MRTVNDGEQEAKRTTVRLAAAYFPSVDLCAVLASVAVLGAGSLRPVDGDLEIGTLTAFLLYLRGFFSPVYELSNVYDSVLAASAGAERIGDIMATEPDVAEAATPVRLKSVQGAIALTDIRFGYPDEAGGAGPDVINGVSLAVPTGTTLALIGPSGAGKSTLAKLMLRFYDPRTGSVTLDGVNLKDLATADLRRAVAYVPQDGFLFAGSILDNVRYGRPTASRDEVEAAARTLGVWSALAVAPDGLDSQVGERGSRLSASQRQIIAIMRAWLADPAVLIWDEATSSLDAETDQAVQLATRTLRHGRTMIIIAHRLVNAMESDAVAVIRDGVVADYGTPTELSAVIDWPRPEAARFA